MMDIEQLRKLSKTIYDTTSTRVSFVFKSYGNAIGVVLDNGFEPVPEKVIDIVDGFFVDKDTEHIFIKQRFVKLPSVETETFGIVSEVNEDEFLFVVQPLDKPIKIGYSTGDDHPEVGEAVCVTTFFNKKTKELEQFGWKSVNMG